MKKILIFIILLAAIGSGAIAYAFEKNSNTSVNSTELNNQQAFSNSSSNNTDNSGSQVNQSTENQSNSSNNSNNENSKSNVELNKVIPINKYVFYKGNGLNIYEEMNVNSNIKGTVSWGFYIVSKETVEKDGKYQDWYKIRFGGAMSHVYEGYIQSNDLDKHIKYVTEKEFGGSLTGDFFDPPIATNTNSEAPYIPSDFYGTWTATKITGTDSFFGDATLSTIDKNIIIGKNSFKFNGYTFKENWQIEPFNADKFFARVKSSASQAGLSSIKYILTDNSESYLYIVDRNHLIFNMEGVYFEFQRD